MDIIPHHRSRGLKIALMSAVVFGIWPASMRGMYAEGGNAVFALLITTWVRALALAGFCVMTRRLLFQTRTDTRNAITGGFAQAVAMLALCAALTLLPGPLVIIILFSHTLMLLFYMAWRGEVRLDRFTVLTTIVALAGLALALDVIHAQSASNITGYSLAFLAAIATVARLYVYGHQTQARHPIIVGAENFLAAAAFTLPALFFSVPHAPASFVGYAYLLLGWQGAQGAGQQSQEKSRLIVFSCEIHTARRLCWRAVLLCARSII